MDDFVNPTKFSRKLSTEERFMYRVVYVAKGYNTDCWLWQGYVDRNGYGVFYVGPFAFRAHKWSYVHFVGSVKDDSVLDHLCRVRSCANPYHLEVVSIGENVRRGVISRVGKLAGGGLVSSVAYSDVSFFARVVEEDCGFTSACWIWQLSPSKDGYGRVLDKGKTKFVHRWVFERWHRQLEKGEKVDHLCSVRLCCNPNHLEGVSHASNQELQHARWHRHHNPSSTTVPFEHRRHKTHPVT